MIVVGAVAQDLQPALVDHEHRQLVGAGSHHEGTRGIAPDSPETVLRLLAKTSRSEIHRSQHAARERNGQAVVRSDSCAPLAVLIPHHSLPRNQVGIGPAPAGRFVGPVEIDEQMVFGGLLDRAMVEIDHLLVVTVHEVDLHTAHPPLFVQGKRLVHLPVGTRPVQPEEDSDPAITGVPDQAGQIQLRHDPGDIGAGIRCPTAVHRPLCKGRAIPVPVHQLVLPVHLSGEVHEVAHRRRVHPDLKIHFRSIAAAPPAIPGRFARPDPVGVDGHRIVEVLKQIRFDEGPRPIGDHDHPPG